MLYSQQWKTIINFWIFTKQSFIQMITIRTKWGNFEFERETNLSGISKITDYFIPALFNTSIIDYNIISLSTKIKTFIPIFIIEETKNDWDSYVYDQSEVVRFVTSKPTFILSFHDFICIKSDENYALRVEVTDLDHKNQNWIQLNIIESTLTITNLDSNSKNVFITLTMPIIHSFILEVTLGNWSLINWTTWKLIASTNQEECVEVSKSESDIVTKEYKTMHGFDFAKIFNWINK